MSQAYKIASTDSSCRKRKDIARHDNKGPVTAVLEKVDRILIRNLSERGGTGKMRSFWEDKVHVVIKNLNSENVTYRVQPENDLNGKIRTLHRNMLLSYDNLLDNYQWSITGDDYTSNHKSKEDIESKPSDTHKDIKYRIVTRNKGQENKKIAYSDAETESITENEALEFTPKNCSVWTRVKSKESQKERAEMKGLGSMRMWTLQMGKQQNWIINPT